MMAIRKSIGGYERRYYGLVEDILEGGKSRYSRTTILLDCLEASRFDHGAGDFHLRDEGLALVRMASTKGVWNRRFGLEALRPGDWVTFELDSGMGGPLAWELEATADYRRGPRRTVRSIRRLGPGARPVNGQKAAGDAELAYRLNESSNAARGSRPIVSGARMLARMPRSGDCKFIVLDVGQASAILIQQGARNIGLFDAGAPLWFNKGSVPLNLEPPPIARGFIFLSHWDWDHFDLGRRHLPYHQLDWYAPDQDVGFNTARFQAKLGKKLHFVQGPIVGRGFVLARGLGSDRNGSGYQLRYDRGHEAVLLTGDADYQMIDALMKAGITALSIPHHGGKGSAPPVGGTPGRAVASYGVPNRYGHPDETFLAAHGPQGWTVTRTATHGNVRRGHRQLYP